MKRIITTVTIRFSSSKEAFDDPEFQEFIADIKSGAAQRKMRKDIARKGDDLKVTATVHIRQ